MKRLNEKLELHSELNPLLWDGDNLKPEVKERCDEIVATFLSGLKENEIPVYVIDIWIVGSNAAYNYTANSDLDIHVIVDTSRVTPCPQILSTLYNYYKSSFNNNYDISIHGINVELYIEDINTSSISNGIYSLKYNMWEKYPTKDIQIDYGGDINDSEVFKELLDDYNKVLSGEMLPDNLLNYLYILRKLDMQEGKEYGERNLAFKEFRSLGYLDKLKEMIRDNISDELTLESVRESLHDNGVIEAPWDEPEGAQESSSPMSADDDFDFGNMSFEELQSHLMIETLSRPPEVTQSPINTSNSKMTSSLQSPPTQAINEIAADPGFSAYDDEM